MKVYVFESEVSVQDRAMAKTIYDKYVYSADVDSELYLHFGSIPKLGVNPQSRYGTPNGIYCYQLASRFKGAFRKSLKRTKEAVENYQNQERRNLNKEHSRRVLREVFPFASDMRYVIVFKNKDSHKTLRLNSYSKSDFRDDFTKIAKYLVTAIGISIDLAINITHILAVRAPRYTTYEKKISPYGQIIWSVTRTAAHIISSSKIREMLKNNHYLKYDSSSEDNNQGLVVALTNEDYLSSAGKSPLSSKVWANLFRYLGYNGVIDNGSGTIYEAEPTQSVFFSVEGLDVLEVFDHQTEQERKDQERQEQETDTFGKRLIDNPSLLKNDKRLASFFRKDSASLNRLVKVIKNNNYSSPYLGVGKLVEVFDALDMNLVDYLISTKNVVLLSEYIRYTKNFELLADKKVFDFFVGNISGMYTIPSGSMHNKYYIEDVLKETYKHSTNGKYQHILDMYEEKGIKIYKEEAPDTELFVDKIYSPENVKINDSPIETMLKTKPFTEVIDSILESPELKSEPEIIKYLDYKTAFGEKSKLISNLLRSNTVEGFEKLNKYIDLFEGGEKEHLVLGYIVNKGAGDSITFKKEVITNYMNHLTTSEKASVIELLKEQSPMYKGEVKELMAYVMTL